MNKVLLVVDVQKAIVDTNEPHILKCVERINEEINHFPSEDVIYVRHIEEGSEFDEKEISSQLSEKLNVVNDQIILKHYNSAFKDTPLDEILKSRNVKELTIVGFQTEFCIDATIKTGHFLGYNLRVPHDGHDTFDRSDLTRDQMIRHYNNQFTIYAQVI